MLNLDPEDYEPDGYEWGFSADSGPIMWYCFGLPFQSYASANHAGVKSYWDTLEFYRREPGGEPERVSALG